MKKFLFISLLFFLFSCSGDTEKEVGVIEETGDIVDGYIDTMESSISDAKEVKKVMDKRYENLDTNR
ncbi:hypothetical protein CSB07_00400 [Candidatus Gracilibacteria bacterium]|nr:MAG: hypothetical protein CSB07_00400 [Candidatus Gracilibacteria bacterium]PIE85116.1 MAG: hypothetical protein CSA08_03665 [Candidatus Gracilibacteria bacterium]